MIFLDYKLIFKHYLYNLVTYLLTILDIFKSGILYIFEYVTDIIRDIVNKHGN
jgi:hypothetical protein